LLRSLYDKKADRERRQRQRKERGKQAGGCGLEEGGKQRRSVKTGNGRSETNERKGEQNRRETRAT
jgi:hypothetical protein